MVGWSINEWDYDNQQLEMRIEYDANSENGYEVVIKSLNKSPNINDEFLNEVIKSLLIILDLFFLIYSS